MSDAEKSEIWHSLLFGQRAILLRLGAALKRDFGLTLAQFEALQLLSRAEDGSVTASELGRALLYSSGSTTNLVKRMEASNLVRRTQCPNDARVAHVSLTEHGADINRRAADAQRAAIRREFFPLLTDEETAGIVAFARRLAAQEDLASLPQMPQTPAPTTGPA